MENWENKKTVFYTNRPRVARSARSPMPDESVSEPNFLQKPAGEDFSTRQPPPLHYSIVVVYIPVLRTGYVTPGLELGGGKRRPAEQRDEDACARELASMT